MMRYLSETHSSVLCVGTLVVAASIFIWLEITHKNAGFEKKLAKIWNGCGLAIEYVAFGCCNKWEIIKPPFTPSLYHIIQLSSSKGNWNELSLFSPDSSWISKLFLLCGNIQMGTKGKIKWHECNPLSPSFIPHYFHSQSCTYVHPFVIIRST